MAEIWLAASIQAHDFVPPDFWRSFAGKMEQDYLPASDNRVWVGLHGRVEGFIALRGEKIEALFVDPAARGRGIGSSLLREAMDARESLRLFYYPANSSAGQFYRRHGFKEGKTDVDPLTGEPQREMSWERNAKPIRSNE